MNYDVTLTENYRAWRIWAWCCLVSTNPHINRCLPDEPSYKDGGYKPGKDPVGPPPGPPAGPGPKTPEPPKK